MKTYALLGGAVLLITLSSLALLLAPFPMAPFTICCCLWSEVVFFCGIAWIEKRCSDGSEPVLRAGAGALLGVYAVANGAASFLPIVMPLTLLLACAIQLVLLGGFILAGAGLWALARHKKESDERVGQVVQSNESLAVRLQNCSVGARDEALAKQLNSCAEEMRFADWAIRVEIDCDIEECVAQIERFLMLDPAKNDKGITGVAERLGVLLDQRKNIVKLERRGGF